MCLITQPYVPNYRSKFYELVGKALYESGFEMKIYIGGIDREQSSRNDSSDNESIIKTKAFKFKIKGINFIFRRKIPVKKKTVIITEFSATNLNLWKWIFQGYRKNIILWGHGMSTLKSPNFVDVKLETLLARLCSSVIVYMPNAKQFLSSRGVPEQKIFVLFNSTDTELLKHLARITTLEQKKQILKEYNISINSHLVIFVGGIDSRKDPQFLIDAANEAHKIDPNFCLVLAGEGDQASKFQSNGHIKLIGKVSELQLVALCQFASAFWVPKWIGLVAVDALTFGLPVYTRKNESHAPEVEYLRNNDLLHELSRTPSQFAKEYFQSEKSKVQVGELPSLQKMTSIFIEAIRLI